MSVRSSPLQSALHFACAVLTPIHHLAPQDSPGEAAGLSPKQNSRRYPIRLARYLIAYAWMEAHRTRLNRPLRIAEIGIGSGQQKKCADFVWQHSPAHLHTGQQLYHQWDGFDVALQDDDSLAQAGYHTLETFNADVEQPRSFFRYDVILLIHVLEHLRDPETFMEHLAARLSPGSLVIGGVPSIPHPFQQLRESRLRKKYDQGGHWCQFSSRRVKNILRTRSWTDAEVTGAFALRSSGSPLEDSIRWIHFNLAFAHLFPWWPGEVYFQAQTNPSAPLQPSITPRPSDINASR